MGMPKNLFLVRHGQSEGNLIRKKFEESGNEAFFSDEFLGLHESQYALTELGVSQAEKAGQWLRDKEFTHFDRMLVSNNVRAMQTAAHLKIPDAIWMIDFNLRERDGGMFNSIVPSKRDSDYADQQKFYNTQPFLFRPPQGESIADVSQRIKLVLDTLARECDGKDVIIVCHGHVMRTFRIVLEKISLQKTNEFLSGNDEWARVPNCSIIHYTRKNPFQDVLQLSDRFDWIRVIRPAGGGNPEDEFSTIERKKFSNQELLTEAIKNRSVGMEQISEEKINILITTYNWDRDMVIKKIAETQTLLGLPSLNDAINFITGLNKKAIICDGCNVRKPWEHRCHREHALVMDKSANHRCECADCFVVFELGID